MGVAYDVVMWRSLPNLRLRESASEKMTDTVIDFTEASTELETEASYNSQNRSVSLPLALLERFVCIAFQQ